jgi:glycosyltransferase involved in cell wall biosynthesis
VILEAFASGLPVLGVKAGGSIDLIDPGSNGLLARPRDPVDLADKAHHILSDRVEYLEMKKGASKTVRSFDWDLVNRRLASSYERIIREHQYPVENGALELAAG